MTENGTKKLTLSAMFFAIGMVLPFLTGQIPAIARWFSPMHYPVYLCGMLVGWPWGLAVGGLLPLVRSVTFGMPKLFPSAIAMAMELAVYGGVAGAIYAKTKEKGVAGIYMALVPAMLCGRLVWGAARYVLTGFSGDAFTFQMFLAGALLEAVPGIVMQLILIPGIVQALKSQNAAVLR